MGLKKTVIFSVILAGTTAMASQIVFLREFLIIFYGNEISIGMILASWLIWGALGSIVLGRFADRLRGKVRVFYMCQLTLALVLPCVLMGIRLSRPAMGITTGEIIGYFPMMLATFTLLSAPCAVMGFMFALSCRIYAAEADVPAGGIARVYSMESVGAILGGVLASYFLIPRMEAFDIVFLLSALNIIGAVAMERHEERPGARGPALVFTALFLAAALVVLYAGGGAAIKKYSIARQWSGFNVLGSKDSIYGNITVTRRQDQVSFYENGLHLYTVPDLFSAEQAVHFPLLEHPSPKKVLMIGGGAGGMLREALKHPVERVDYVELDPLIVSMAREYLPAGDAVFLDKPEVRIINADGRFYVKRAREKYDCVMIALGTPYTAQINRFYTVDFFRELKSILDDGGVVSFGLTASADYIGEELAEYLRSIYLSLGQVFADIVVVPGDTMMFIAAGKPGVLTYKTDVLMSRMKERKVDALYVREYYLFDVLSPERINYAETAMAKGCGAVLNTDFRPISYYFATLFWNTQFDAPATRNLLRSVSADRIWLFAALFCLLLFVSIALKQKGRGKAAVLTAVMTTGFAEIIFQIAVILSFQVIYGYVFYKIGVIITSFMLGLALGSIAIGRAMPRIRDARRLFIAAQAGICLYPLVLPLVFGLFAASRCGAADWVGSNLIFPFLPVIAGAIGGIQFPLANKIYLADKKDTGKIAGLSYGVDLMGACIGSLLAASFLVPVLGIFETCLLAALINVTVFALLLLPVKAA